MRNSQNHFSPQSEGICLDAELDEEKSRPSQIEILSPEQVIDSPLKQPRIKYSELASSHDFGVASHACSSTDVAKSQIVRG